MTSSTRSPDSARLERFAVIQSLSAGTVPAVGLRLLQVGRDEELKAIEDDLRRAEQGVSSVRFISGPPESGKTFFLNLVRSVAMDRGFVVARTEFTASRRLHSATGEARAMYRDLMTHLAVVGAADGISMGALVHAWVARLESEAVSAGQKDARERIAAAVRPLHELSTGFDFATVLLRYHEGHLTRNDQLRENALRWLRGEYVDRAEASADLGVRSIIDDDTVRDAISLFAAFVRLAGHSGFVVLADELSMLTRRIKDNTARRENYDVIVEMLSDCLEGRSRWMVMLFGIEDSCVDDRQRGLYSNQVLATWLAPNRFASNGHRDLSAPVIRLTGLKLEDFPTLLGNVRNVYRASVASGELLPDEGIAEYVRLSEERMGAAYFDNPREVVKDFIDLLHLLAQHPDANWRGLIAEARPPQVSSAMLPMFGEDTERGTWPGWYAEQLAIERQARFRRRFLAAVFVPLILVSAIWGGWTLLKPKPVPLSSSLIVKYSDVRGGLRQPLDEVAVPLRIDNYYSIEANPIEPCHLYIFVLDSQGRLIPGTEYGKEAGEPQRGRLQHPGEDVMWPVLDPLGTRIVLLLGSKSPVTNLSALRGRLQGLRPVPDIATSAYVELRDGKPFEKRNPALQSDPSSAFDSELGFLSTLEAEFGAEFPIIEAVAFRVVPSTPSLSPGLGDLQDRK